MSFLHYSSPYFFLSVLSNRLPVNSVSFCFTCFILCGCFIIMFANSVNLHFCLRISSFIFVILLTFLLSFSFNVFDHFPLFSLSPSNFLKTAVLNSPTHSTPIHPGYCMNTVIHLICYIMIWLPSCF